MYLEYKGNAFFISPVVIPELCPLSFKSLNLEKN
jgi:hypothetical protein